MGPPLCEGTYALMAQHRDRRLFPGWGTHSEGSRSQPQAAYSELAEATDLEGEVHQIRKQPGRRSAEARDRARVHQPGSPPFDVGLLDDGSLMRMPAAHHVLVAGAGEPSPVVRVVRGGDPPPSQPQISVLAIVGQHRSKRRRDCTTPAHRQGCCHARCASAARARAAAAARSRQ
jgi:hypothetical protein